MLNNRLGRVALLALLPLSFYGCSSDGYQVEKITASHIEVDPSVPEDVRMEAFLAPYRDSLSALLDQVIAYSPQSLSKNDQNGLLGAWLADLSIGQVEAYLRSQGVDPQIDIALSTQAAERTSLPQGDVKRSFVYEFMPSRTNTCWCACGTADGGDVPLSGRCRLAGNRSIRWAG